jgi:hypothetical protein
MASPMRSVPPGIWRWPGDAVATPTMAAAMNENTSISPVADLP